MALHWLRGVLDLRTGVHMHVTRGGYKWTAHADPGVRPSAVVRALVHAAELVLPAGVVCAAASYDVGGWPILEADAGDVWEAIVVEVARVDARGGGQ